MGLLCSPIHAEIFVGAGPDPACGGTSLKVEKKEDKIIFIEHTIFASSKTIVEQFRLNSEGNWDITLLVYSTRWTDNEPLTEDKIVSTHRFKNTEIKQAKEISEEISFRDF